MTVAATASGVYLDNAKDKQEQREEVGLNLTGFRPFFVEILKLHLPLMKTRDTREYPLCCGGYIEGTSLPGQSGTVGIAAHRDAFSRKLRWIQTGDIITVQTIEPSCFYPKEYCPGTLDGLLVAASAISPLCFCLQRSDNPSERLLMAPLTRNIRKGRDALKASVA